MGDQLRIGVIGLGRWGPNHIRNFQAMKNCVVTAAADPDATSTKRARSTYPSVEYFKDHKELLEKTDVDAVVVATSTGSHYAIVKEALEAGCHVLCEKPLTDKSEEAWELVSCAEGKQCVLMVGHVFLFNAGVSYLHEAVTNDEMGDLYYLSATRTNLGPFREDVNAAWDLASHDIYIFNHLVGRRPEAVSASGGSYLREPVEDIVFMTLFYPGGVLGNIHVSWLDPKKVRQITLVGKRKMITWDDLGVPGPVMIYDRAVVKDPTYHTYGEFQLLAREGDVVIPRIALQEPLSAQAQAFARQCLNADQQPGRGSAREGAEVVDILEATTRSIAAGGAKQVINYGQ